MKKCAVIGVGYKTQQDYIPALQQSRHVEIDCLVDTDAEALARTSKILGGVPCYADTAAMLRERRPDMALVCVPHDHYIDIVRTLVEHKVPVLKEKPIARTVEEAQQLLAIAEAADVPLYVTVSRRYHPIYRSAENLLDRIGHVVCVEGKYTLSIDDLSEGWRASAQRSGGGAVLDMGYHLIDLLIWYFGRPSRIYALGGQKARPHQDYDVEDTAQLLLGYEHPRFGAFSASLTISRAYPTKDEYLMIVGSKGSILLKRGEVIHLDTKGNEVEALMRRGTWITAATEQIESFARMIASQSAAEVLAQTRRQIVHMEVVKSCYDQMLRQNPAPAPVARTLQEA